MIRASLLNLRRWAMPGVKAATSLPTWRELMLIGAAGVASAAISQVLGRTLHLTWSLPASGSILATLPRAIILLVLLTRVNRFGALTAAGVAEIGAKLAFGAGGMWPMALIAPLLGNFTGDLLWTSLRRLEARRARLMMTGAGLCAARVSAALVLWSLLRPVAAKAPQHLASWVVCIVAINAGLGLAAGFLASGRKRSRVDDQGA